MPLRSRDTTKGSKIRLAFIIPMALAFVSYAGTLQNGFVYDDVNQIVQNPMIRNLSHLGEAFVKDIWACWGNEHSGYYRPLMQVVNTVMYALFGLNATAYHCLSILAHVINTMLVFVIGLSLARRLTEHDAETIALMGSMLFAAHPVHVEAVAWISSFTELAFTALWLASFHLYANRGKVGLAAIPYFVSMFFKDTAILLPLILLSYDALFARDLSLRGYVRRLLPFICTATIYLAMRIYAIGLSAPAASTFAKIGIVNYLPNAAYLLSLFMLKLFAPVNLTLNNLYSPVDSPISVKGLAAMALIPIFMCIPFIMRHHKSRLMLIAFIIVPLLPVLYYPLLGPAALSDRYLYFPSVGWAILMPMILVRSRARTIAIIILPLIALLFGIGAFKRGGAWKDNISLWADTVQSIRGINPEAEARYINNLATALHAQGRMDEAERYMNEALRLYPNSDTVHKNLGSLYLRKGMFVLSERELREAVRLNPKHSEAYMSLGVLYYRQGRTVEAEAAYRTSIELNPLNATAHYNLGNLYFETKDIDRAIEQYRRAVEIFPDNEDAAYNLKVALKMKGK